MFLCAEQVRVAQLFAERRHLAGLRCLLVRTAGGPGAGQMDCFPEVAQGEARAGPFGAAAAPRALERTTSQAKRRAAHD